MGRVLPSVKRKALEAGVGGRVWHPGGRGEAKQGKEFH